VCSWESNEKIERWGMMGMNEGEEEEMEGETMNRALGAKEESM